MNRRITATTDDADVVEAKASLMEAKKKHKRRKDLPSISHMLAHGAPESQGRPKTWKEIIGYPLALAVVFLISLLIFHHAPHHLSKQPKRKFSLPKKNNRAPQQQQTTVPKDMMKNKEKNTEL